MQKKIIWLVDECTETVEEVKLAKTTLAGNENSDKRSLCTVYVLLFWIFFTTNVGGIDAYFIYFHGYLKKMFARETTIYWTYKWDYVTVKKIANCNYINSVNPLYLMINEIDWSFWRKKWKYIFSFGWCGWKIGEND